MALKKVSCILYVIIFQAALTSSFHLLEGFHKLLSTTQLIKYFGVQNLADVPDYTFVNIQLKIPNIFHWIHNLGINQEKEESHPEDIFISTRPIFGHSVQMELRKNNRLLAPSFKAFQIGGSNEQAQFMDSRFSVGHYIGKNGSTVAAFSSYQYTSAKGLYGIMLLPNGGVQIQPVDQELSSLLGFFDNQFTRPLLNSVLEVMHLAFKPKSIPFVSNEQWDDEVNVNNNFKYLHSKKFKKISHKIKKISKTKKLLKRKGKRDLFTNLLDSVPSFPFALEMKHATDDDDNDIEDTHSKGREEVSKSKSKEDLQLELAVFFDQPGYETFMPHMKSEEKIADLLLGFVNQMHALYQLPSLSRKVQISLVRLELFKKQPDDLPHSEGEKDKLLATFCKYQKNKNPESDDDPDHWDIALYISGLNFHGMTKGKQSAITIGKAFTSGVCRSHESCGIIEFGAVRDDGSPYITAGLASTFVAVHEVGHNLGMKHDGPPHNDCPKDGYIMSPIKDTKGETTWSSCSSDYLDNFDKECLSDVPQETTSRSKNHNKYNAKPGKVWSARDQCKIFLKDEDATLLDDSDLSGVCEEILCKIPQDTKQYSAGPGLEGTSCGKKKWCQNGQCVSGDSKKVKPV